MKGPGSRVAKRYARALLALAERNQVEAWGAELERFARLAESPEIAASLQSPELAQDQRIEAVAKIAEKLELSYPVRSFVVVVARHHRVDEFGAIAQSYSDLLDKMLNRARAQLTFAYQPSDEESGKVIKGLEAMTGKSIIATIQTDPALLGGVVAEIQGRIYDGSLAARLDEARRRLAG